MDWTTFAIRVCLATIAGLIIGMEREIQGKEAGLKTNALVSLGASIFILMSLEFEGDKYVDITRVLGQVVVGIGFIGAGTILQHGKEVKGLTTAATIWCSAGAGCLAGFGLFIELAILSGIILTINLIFGYVQHRIKKKKEKEEDSD
ncbi:MgtC/SapB family protein [Christiangramia sabulilitoris]|uniref:MgtC/SapB family protein n=1 Tax=Christiangramia sabulilitoris TaxID=2583991 RepID=A0A550I0I9_9FLAO|nr:MgtC/SapB family protein [Christiangramia sabulilitoris]TRO64450.1 MgtC/SapB family protein [Christiangramia sabulilitoris]